MKKRIFIIALLIGLQLFRIILKSLTFLIFEKSILRVTIFNIFYTILIIGLFIYVCKKKNIKLKIFPEKFTVNYISFSGIVLIWFVAVLICTKNYYIDSIASLIYNAILIVIFEEILFRGFVYDNIAETEEDKYLYSSILFGIWQIGYIDTIMYRTSVLNPNADIINIMFWKVITGVILGIIFGFFRYKNKNIYSSMLPHMFVNIIGN